MQSNTAARRRVRRGVWWYSTLITLPGPSSSTPGRIASHCSRYFPSTAQASTRQRVEPHRQCQRPCSSSQPLSTIQATVRGRGNHAMPVVRRAYLAAELAVRCRLALGTVLARVWLALVIFVLRGASVKWGRSWQGGGTGAMHRCHMNSGKGW